MRRLFFLHLPKTAGQSVDAYLRASLKTQSFCPARVNEQLDRISPTDLREFEVFSGHFDWTTLLAIDPVAIAFTVLREPRDRILSFYFYLRREATKLDEEALHSGRHEGMRCALELTPDEFFVDVEGPVRRFLDDHFDNFYTSFFATGSFRGRGWLEQAEVPGERRVELAARGLSKLDAVYNMATWKDGLAELLPRVYPGTIPPERTAHVNRGDGLSVASRTEELVRLGASERSLQQIERWCRWDELLISTGSRLTDLD